MSASSRNTTTKPRFSSEQTDVTTILDKQYQGRCTIDEICARLKVSASELKTAIVLSEDAATEAADHINQGFGRNAEDTFGSLRVYLFQKTHVEVLPAPTRTVVGIAVIDICSKATVLGTQHVQTIKQLI